MTKYTYPGGELALFAQATNWKSYVRSRLKQHISGTVLEVGAGIGETTRVLCHGDVTSWTCLEPDNSLANQLDSALEQGKLPPCCSLRRGTVASLREGESFDSILYIDVLEHIQNDREEVSTAARRLRPGGKLIILCPAHQWLFSEFDTALGHYRRYSLSSLIALTPDGVQIESKEYVDSVGMLASLGNRALLRQSLPTPRQIAVWDQFMVPLSRFIDPLVVRRWGKSVIVIWQKEKTQREPCGTREVAFV